MGVNTDGEDTNPETSLKDETQHTTESWQMEHKTEYAGSTKNFLLDDECVGGIQDQKLMGATDTSLITRKENMSSQNTSVVSITEQTSPQPDNTDGGDIVLSNHSDRKEEMLNSTPASFITNSSTSDDMCTKLKEYRLQGLDVVKILDTDVNDALEEWDTVYKTLIGETSSGDADGRIHELQLNHDIDKLDDEGYTPLYNATLEGDIKAIAYLISQGANLDKPSKDGVRPLHAAAQEGHADTVDFLILRGADPRVKCNMGQTPLHTAAANGHTSIIECVIAEGVDVNEEDNSGWTPFNASIERGHLESLKFIMTIGGKQNRYDGMTPLYAAAKFGHLDIVEFLVNSGADVNEEGYRGRIPLHQAAISGNIKVMEYLIQQGSDVNKAATKGRTPFNAAIQSGHLEAVKYLMDKGAKQNRYAGMTPLYAAAKFGHIDIVKFFISNGADVNEENDDGKIPLHGAATNGYIKIMEYLIQRGTDVNKAGTKGWTPFNAAIQCGHLEAVTYLIDKGAKQNRYDGATPLHFAAQFGDIDIVKFFISNGADVNEGNDNGMIPLHTAAMKGSMKIMEYLIQQGSDVNKADSEGGTPFNAAIQYGHLEAVKYLMDNGAKQNRYGGMTPLYAAARFGHLDIVKFLISAGADVNEENDDGRISLHGATFKGNIKIMRYLIKRGSQVNKADSKGGRPFNAAIQEGHLKAVKYLLGKGADQIRFRGMTPLYAAAQHGHLDMVKFLISIAADVNDENYNGRIPLHGAAINGSMKIMEYLICRGSDVNKADEKGWTVFHAAVQYGHVEALEHLLRNGAIQGRFNGMTPLYIAAQAGHFDTVKFLISNGADVNEVDDEGMTALHAAARKGKIEIIEFLIQQGSDVNKAGDNGLTPFNAAIIEGHSEIVKFLLAKGANYISYEGMTPLYIGTQYHHIEVVRFLLSKGYNVNEGTESGKSPLHAACYNGNKEMVYLLILNNADANQQDQDGWTPLQAAVQEGYQDISDYLIVHGAHMKDSDDFASTHTTPNTGHYTLTERILNKHHCAEDEKREHEQNDHQTAMKAECETSSMTDPEKQSCTAHTPKPKLHVKNIYNGNTFIQADVEDERCAELSLRALSTGAHKAKDRANEEPNPFPGAKPKSPHKSEHGSTQDDIDAAQTSMARKQYDRTNDTSRPVPLGPRKWQYSGYVRPLIQTQYNSMISDQISEDPESRCFVLAKEIGHTRKPPNLINKRNDRDTHGGSSESTRTLISEPSQIVHQVVFDKRHLSHIGTTSANTEWKFLSEHRNASTCRSPTILLFLQTFLQMILAVAILLAGGPVHVGADVVTEEVTLLAGSRGVVPFYFPVSSNDSFLRLPNYLLQFESQRRPFCVHGKNHIEGFKGPTQAQRFKTKITNLDTFPSVNLIIDNVEILDQDGYLFTAILHHSLEDVEYETVKKKVFVQIPHGPAECFININENHEFTFEAHCRATSGSTATTISCYQNGQKLHSRNSIADDGQVTRGIYFLQFKTRFACCSHEVTSVVSAETCNDFEWPPLKPRADATTHITSIVPNSVNSTRDRPVSMTSNPTTHIKYDADSGASRQFIHTFILFVSALFVGVLNSVLCSHEESSLI